MFRAVPSADVASIRSIKRFDYSTYIAAGTNPRYIMDAGVPLSAMVEADQSGMHRLVEDGLMSVDLRSQPITMKLVAYFGAETVRRNLLRTADDALAIAATLPETLDTPIDVLLSKCAAHPDHAEAVILVRARSSDLTAQHKQPGDNTSILKALHGVSMNTLIQTGISGATLKKHGISTSELVTRFGASAEELTSLGLGVTFAT